MQVEEPQAPMPIAKHGAWMIVNCKLKVSERGPAKSTGKPKGETKHILTNPSNGTRAARNNTRTGDMDLEGLQETLVLLEEETVLRGTSKTRNNRKKNKGNKQTTTSPGMTSSPTGLFSKGTSVSDQLFVFGNLSSTPSNPSLGESYNACGLLDAGTMGVRYSWYRHEGGRIVLRKKLDRVLKHHEKLN
nr:reverse transcriptase [Ipomoea batatas]